MITVEDLIIALSTNFNGSLQSHDKSLVDSFTRQIRTNGGLTEKQGNWALKIIKKYQKNLSVLTNTNISKFLEQPVYKYPFRQARTTKKISVIDKTNEAIFTKIIKVEFPYNESVVNYIKENRLRIDVAYWNAEERAWLFNLSERNVNFLKHLAEKENFEYDEEFAQLSRQQTRIIDHMNDHVPMLDLDNGKPYYKNASQYLPKLESTEILSAIFEARRRGINIWGDEIENFVMNLQNPALKQFLTFNSDQYPVHIDCNTNPISSLKEIVLNLRPCIFVIPTNLEAATTKLCYDFLVNTCGIAEKHISVLFRMSSITGKDFNDLVKDFGLNNPLSNDTEVVMISGKVPKPLIKSGIYFNSVVNFGYDNAHYTCKHLIINHHNLIHYTEFEKKQYPSALLEFLS